MGKSIVGVPTESYPSPRESSDRKYGTYPMKYSLIYVRIEPNGLQGNLHVRKDRENKEKLHAACAI